MFSNPFITSTLDQNQPSASQASGAVLHTRELEGSGHTTSRSFKIWQRPTADSKYPKPTTLDL